jgi:hypothetical protein
LFNYLEENIFELQPPAVQAFMVKTALLPMMDVRLCNRILNIHNAGKLLLGLVENHLLTFPLDGEKKSFHYHHLLRDFLVEKLHKTYSPEEIEHLHIRIGLAYEKENILEALSHYIDGKAFDRAAKLLMEQVLDEIDATSPTFIITMTFLIFLSAVLGEIEDADGYTEQARAVIIDYPECERGVATALITLSTAYRYYITGDFHHSQTLNLKLLEQVLDLKIDACLPLTYYQCAATDFFLGHYEKGYGHAARGIQVSERIELQDSQKGWLYGE